MLLQGTALATTRRLHHLWISLATPSSAVWGFLQNTWTTRIYGDVTDGVHAYGKHVAAVLYQCSATLACVSTVNHRTHSSVVTLIRSYRSPTSTVAENRLLSSVMPGTLDTGESVRYCQFPYPCFQFFDVAHWPGRLVRSGIAMTAWLWSSCQYLLSLPSVLFYLRSFSTFTEDWIKKLLKDRANWWKVSLQMEITSTPSWF